MSRTNLNPFPSLRPAEIRPHLRWLIRRDYPSVLTIDRLSFEEPFAWGEETYLKSLRESNVIGMVAESGETVIGSMVYILRKTSIELIRFAVHPGYRRRRVGTAMVWKLLGKLSSHRRTRLDLVIPESMLDAHLFFRSQGFLATDVSRHYFDFEDGYRFVYRFDPETEGVQRWGW